MVHCSAVQVRATVACVSALPMLRKTLRRCRITMGRTPADSFGFCSCRLRGRDSAPVGQLLSQERAAEGWTASLAEISHWVRGVGPTADTRDDALCPGQPHVPQGPAAGGLDTPGIGPARPEFGRPIMGNTHLRWTDWTPTFHAPTLSGGLPPGHTTNGLCRRAVIEAVGCAHRSNATDMGMPPPPLLTHP